MTYMPRFALRTMLMLCALTLSTRTAAGRDVPPLEHRVTDLAGLIDAKQKMRIASHLKSYEMRTGRQFVMLIVPSLDDEPIEMYSIRVAEAWKIGRKPHDDGLLLLIAAREHKMRIEIGYGLEADITDALSSQVIHNILQPSFRAGAFGDGIVQAFDVLMAAADKSPVEGLLPKDNGAEMDTKTELQVGFWVLVAVVCLLLIGPRASLDILVLLLSMLGRGGGGRSGRGGGNDSFSGGGGGFGGGGASGDW